MTSVIHDVAKARFTTVSHNTVLGAFIIQIGLLAVQNEVVLSDAEIHCELLVKHKEGENIDVVLNATRFNKSILYYDEVHEDNLALCLTFFKERCEILTVRNNFSYRKKPSGKRQAVRSFFLNKTFRGRS